ncbi:hypothetical protein BIY21_13250 [Vibrio ponticus]|uniref:Uncharacterized protein n=1 Tax=Vibrio ponticus TaxID=265668 RepID=A0ABX3FGG7_9VIBR|nr:hypothetical protein [Vibrio ponticus]OLQ91626.1 hypothetical protein BIY21_13250 [Vibrio ponticus]
MGLFSNLFGRQEKAPIDESQAQSLQQEIRVLESHLESEPANVEVQQALIAKYSQASSVYSQAPSFRGQVNDVFTRLNELRNMARSNF